MGSVRLRGRVDDMRSQLEVQLARGRKIKTLPRRNKIEISELKNQFLSWNEFNSTLLDTSFESHGTMTQTPRNEFGVSDIAIMDLKLGTSTKTDAALISAIDSTLDEKIRILTSIADRLEVWADSPPAPELKQQGDEIFLVHGRDMAARETVRGFLERVTSRSVIVLDEEAGSGNDILGKLLSQAQKAGFAVVLLTGDDRGRLATADSEQPRARQNVILELGLFIGILGREKVVALYQNGVELPSDYLGVSYVALDSGKSWQIDLVRELRAAGIDASLDKIL